MAFTTKIELSGVSSLEAASNISKALSSIPQVISLPVSDAFAHVEHNGVDAKLLIAAVGKAGNFTAKIVKTKRA